MHKKLARELKHNNIRLLKDGQDVIEDITVIEFNGIPGNKIIRIREEEYKHIPENAEFLTHFNLQESDHEEAEKYLLPKIVKPGFFDGEKEVLPLLSFNGIYFGECVESKKYLKYEDLTEEDFQHSMNHIKNVYELRNAILLRYTESLPKLKNEEIIELGVSKTTIKILGRL